MQRRSMLGASLAGLFGALAVREAAAATETPARQRVVYHLADADASSSFWATSRTMSMALVAPARPISGWSCMGPRFAPSTRSPPKITPLR
ncbi:hypothetical protein ACVIWV_004233 [Bradyrhizobium diazoefficiens]